MTRSTAAVSCSTVMPHKYTRRPVPPSNERRRMFRGTGAANWRLCVFILFYVGRAVASDSCHRFIVSARGRSGTVDGTEDACTQSNEKMMDETAASGADDRRTKCAMNDHSPVGVLRRNSALDRVTTLSKSTGDCCIYGSTGTVRVTTHLQ